MATTDRLPLPTLFSQVMVAYVIEFDNEFEHRMPHRTSRYGPGGPPPPVTADGRRMRRPWLVSMATWWDFLRLVGDGVVVREQERQAGATKEAMHISLGGMTRWGYVVVAPDPADKRPAPPPRDRVVHATLAGQWALEVWRPLPEIVEARWQSRLGSGAVEALRQSLEAMVDEPGLPLSALLGSLLTAFRSEFETSSVLSLPVYANVVRLLDGQDRRVRDLPALAGISTEAIDNSLGPLDKRGMVVMGVSSTSRTVRLSERGLLAQHACERQLSLVEERWSSRSDLGALRSSLEALIGPRLFEGLKQYPDGWRAKVRPPAALPHYPMISHRGGFPDGS